MQGAKVFFYPSGKERSNLQIIRNLQKLSQHFQLVVVTPAAVLKGYCELPFLRTESGRTFSGRDGIRRFTNDFNEEYLTHPTILP